ncbi:MAG: fructosamine kinase family protein [Planctomycetota bacterium]|jgi:protein-ribulosamine 3-kinase|nr:fructosamine kinase family protein [Planctomycetota bacterium]
MLPKSVTTWLAKHGHGAVVSDHSVSGGCINDTRVLRTDAGSTVFCKHNPAAPAALFAAEAAGLQALAIAGAPRVPEVYAVDDHFLLLEYLPPGPRRADYWACFGRALAALHAQGDEHFGFAVDTYCGDTRQPNAACPDGYAFYAQQRFGFQAQLARTAGLIGAREHQRIERFAERLSDWVPVQSPALIHGDLWSGNAHTTSDGAPALIDPAAYYGWPEAELAMTCLFGGFAPDFYAAYEEAAPIAADWRTRVDLHNVYHLLNHANIFGGAYTGQALAVIQRYLGE